MRCGAIIILFTVALGTAALAQATLPENQTATTTDSSSAMDSPPTDGMSEVAIGDYWLYRVRDEIAGKLVGTRKIIVIDISGDQVATRVVNSGRSVAGAVLFDKSWNVLRNGPNRYSPSSGTGIQSPLKLNAEWNATADEVNDDNGTVWSINVDSRVTGLESVTTNAGTFESYTIETTWDGRTEKDPAASRQLSIRTSFSPEVNHWIRRNIVERVDGSVVSNETMELLKYGRKDAP
jgi:hypothetical protein